jgi:L-asparaginase II
MKSAETMINVTRGSLIECIHRGHIAVVNGNGHLLHSLGDPSYVTFARSTAKLIQTIAVVESGATGKFQLTPEEITLLCASHNGEQEHVNTAAHILRKIGLTEDSLQCGPHYPFHAHTTEHMKLQGIAPSSLHNNCSGKHSGMLALATQLTATTEDYMSIHHPVQQRMLRVMSEMSDVPVNNILIGTDGCGVPVYGVPIDKLALAYARLGSPEGLTPERTNACQTIVQSITASPQYLAGTGRFDTQLIQVTQGRVIGKLGAEGVFAMTIPDQDIGIIIKIEDGSKRALYPTAMEVLKQLQILSDEEFNQLQPFHQPVLKNWAGTVIGSIEPQFKLN